MADYTLLTDNELAVLLQSGDRHAFAEIYHRYKFVLHNHAWNKTRNKEEAEDAIHEVFAMIWSKHSVINIGSNLSGYLYNSVRNHLLNMIVRKEVQERYIASIRHFSESSSVIADHRVRENQLTALIEKEIAALPPRMREVFELSRRQHLSHKEIAALMGTSEQTVKKQMNKALRILRNKLGLPLYLVMYFFYR